MKIRRWIRQLFVRAIVMACAGLLVASVPLAARAFASTGASKDYPDGYRVVYAPANPDRLPTSQELASVVALIQGKAIADQIVISDVTSDAKTGEVTVTVARASSSVEASTVARQLEPSLGNPDTLAFTGPDGELIVDGTDVAECHVATMNGQFVVVLELTADGAKTLSDATGRLIGQTITIKVDGKVLSTPTVKVQITDGNAIIDGMADKNEAQALVDKIQASSLAFSMKISSIAPIATSPLQVVQDFLEGHGALVLLGVVAVLLGVAIILLFVVLKKKAKTA